MRKRMVTNYSRGGKQFAPGSISGSREWLPAPRLAWRVPRNGQSGRRGEFLACAVTNPGVSGRLEGPIDFSFGPDCNAPVRILCCGTLEAFSLQQHLSDHLDRDLDAVKVGKRKRLSGCLLIGTGFAGASSLWTGPVSANMAHRQLHIDGAPVTIFSWKTLSSTCAVAR
jgi:hypothetical protein